MNSKLKSMGRRVWDAEICTPWPRLAECAKPTGNPFTSAAFLERWEPGDVVWIYVAGCEGVHRLATRLAMPIFKIGLTLGDVRERLRQLARDGYGATTYRAGEYRTEPGFAPWVACQFDEIETLPGSPLEPEVRGIKVTLPRSMAVDQFDAAFTRATARISVANFLRSNTGHAHCEALDIEPDEALRYTRYGFGVGFRVSLAVELVSFRPRGDTSRLCALAEELILHHLKSLS